MQDMAVAVRQYLLEDSGVSGQVDDRVYVDDLPTTENENMPRSAVVIRSAGGNELASYNHNQTARFDILSYGGTRFDAGVVDGHVAEALHYLKRVVVEGTLLHSVIITGGSRTFKTADTGWPVKLRVIIVRGSMKAA